MHVPVRALLAAAVVASVLASCGPASPSASDVPASDTASGPVASASPAGPSSSADIAFPVPPAWTATRQILPVEPFSLWGTSLGFVVVRGDGRAAWTARSEDGVTWLQGPPIQDAPRTEGEAPWMQLVEGPDRLLLVNPLAEVDGGTAAWTSSDGLEWAPATGLPADRNLISAAATNAGFVGLFVGPRGEKDLWSSADGSTWSSPRALPDTAPYTMWLVRAAGDRVLVAGPDATVTESDTARGRAWVSDGGGPWHASPEDEPALVFAGDDPKVYGRGVEFLGYAASETEAPPEVGLWVNRADGAWEPEAIAGDHVDMRLMFAGPEGLAMTSVGPYAESGEEPPMVSLSRDGRRWFGVEALRPVVDPAEWDTNVVGVAWARGRVVLTVIAWPEEDGGCETGGCGTWLVAGPAPGDPSGWEPRTTYSPERCQIRACGTATIAPTEATPGSRVRVTADNAYFGFWSPLEWASWCASLSIAFHGGAGDVIPEPDALAPITIEDANGGTFVVPELVPGSYRLVFSCSGDEAFASPTVVQPLRVSG